MRLEQRNGRVDRHGQARDVTAFHFASDEDEDLKFIDYVVQGRPGSRRPRQRRERDRPALEERFSAEEVVESELDRRIDQTLERRATRSSARRRAPSRGARRRRREAMERTARELRIDPARLRRLLEQACAVDRGKLDEAADGSYRLQAVPPAGNGRRRLLRLDSKGAVGALPRLVFDTEALMEPSAPAALPRAPRCPAAAARPPADAAGGLDPPPEALAARCRPAQVHDRSSTGLDEPVLVVPAVLTIANELREPLHAELVELAFRHRRAEVAHGPGRSRPAPTRRRRARPLARLARRSLARHRPGDRSAPRIAAGRAGGECPRSASRSPGRGAGSADRALRPAHSRARRGRG